MISTLFILGICYWPWLQHRLRRLVAATRPQPAASTSPDSPARSHDRASGIDPAARSDESSQPS